MKEEQEQHSVVYQAPRSEEMNEIISQPPNWLIRWGITLFFVLIFLLVVCSWTIQYPDIVRAPFRLTAANAPKSVTVKFDGKLVKLLIDNNATVKQNQVLGYMESTADHAQILALETEIKNIQASVQERKDIQPLSEYNRLGELQNDYQNFRRDYTNFMAFQFNGYYAKKRKILEHELVELNRIEKNLVDQQTIQQQSFEIAQSEYKVQQGLAEQKVIAPLELKREESKLLERRMPLKQIESSLYNNATAKLAKQKEILELDKLIQEHEDVFLQSLNTLKSKAESWKVKYVLSAPIDGRVFFSGFVEENQNFALNQEVFFIGPDIKNYFGEVHIPQHNSGKVKVGQNVIVKFASYPFHEYGAIQGKVSFISEITDRDNNFLIKVELPAGLQTNYGKKINYKTGMNATAEIITENMRLIERVFYNLRKALSR
jgi:multidrug efflux pump subunit AcrA (membrane-fusion protein)